MQKPTIATLREMARSILENKIEAGKGAEEACADLQRKIDGDPELASLAIAHCVYFLIEEVKRSIRAEVMGSIPSRDREEQVSDQAEHGRSIQKSGLAVYFATMLSDGTRLGEADGSQLVKQAELNEAQATGHTRSARKWRALHKEYAKRCPKENKILEKVMPASVAERILRET